MNRGSDDNSTDVDESKRNKQESPKSVKSSSGIKSKMNFMSWMGRKKKAQNPTENKNDSPNNSVRADSDFEMKEARYDLSNVSEKSDSQITAISVPVVKCEACNDQERNPFISDVAIMTDSTMHPKFSRSHSFLRKIISDQICRINSEHVAQAEYPQIQSPSTSYDENNKSYVSLTKETPVSIIKVPQACLNISESLQEILNLSNRMQESERYIVDILQRYITDNIFQNQLVDAITNYTKLHVDTERQTYNLVNEIWIQQAEVHKSQENVLKNTVHALIDQNKRLEDNYNTLISKQKLVVLAEPPRNNENESENSSHSEIIADVQENCCGSLRQDLKEQTEYVENLEEQLDDAAAKIRELKGAVNAANAKLQSYKVLLERCEAKCNIENVSHSDVLSEKCKFYAQKIQDDLTNLKEKVKDVDVPIPKLEACHCDNPTVLIRMSTDIVKDLSKIVIATHSRLVEKDQENENLRESNHKLQENLYRSATQLDKIDCRLETCKIHEREFYKCTLRNKELERELNEIKMIHEKEKQEFCAELEKIKRAVPGCDTIKQKYHAIYTELEDTKKSLNSYKVENEAMKLQLEGLNQLLSRSGAGDVARELSVMQGKISYYQNEYYKVFSEKSALEEKNHVLRVERETLINYQKSYQDHLQNRQNDIEKFCKENATLKEQLEAERCTVAALQAERMKHLEEKNILRSIYEQLKNEVARNEKMQTTIIGLNKEANRLAIIAEYNKNLAHKLKEEIEERDVTINKLQGSLDSFQKLQMEYVKDKIVLSTELSQICCNKDKLSNTLFEEMQKNETRKKVEAFQNSQIRAVESMQKTERAALKELLKEFKVIAKHRDELLNEQMKNQQLIADLKKIISQHQKYYSISKFEEKQQRIAELEKQLHEKELALEAANAKIKLEAKSCEDNIQCLKKSNENFENEKENMENTISYLKTNTQKLHQDLNDARQSEKQAKDALNEAVKENKMLENSLKDNVVKLEATLKENEFLNKELCRLSEMCENLARDYEDFETSIEIEKCKIKNETQLKLDESIQKIEHLIEVINQKDEEILQLEGRCQCLELENQRICETIAVLENEHLRLNKQEAEQRMKWENDLQNLRVVQDMYVDEIDGLVTEVERIEQELMRNCQMCANDFEYYKSQISEIKQDYASQKNTMKEDLKILLLKLNETLENFENQKESTDELTCSHKDLCLKLLRTIKALADERIHKNSSKEFAEKYHQVNAEKQTVEEKLREIMKKLEEYKRSLQKLESENESIQKSLEKTQIAYTDSLRKCQSLEEEIKTKEIKYEQYLNSSSMVQCCPCSSAALSKEDNMYNLKSELKLYRDKVFELQKEISVLHQDLTALEFQKCELSLRLHEVKGQLQTERDLNTDMVELQQKLLSKIMELKEEGRLSPDTCDNLLSVVHSQGYDSVLNLTSSEELFE